MVVVLAKAGWDTAGLILAGPRPRGMVLAAALVGAVLAARCAARSGQVWPLRLCLAGLAMWYAVTAAGLLAACVLYDRSLSWPPLLAVMAVAGLAVVAARDSPRQVGGGQCGGR